MYVIIAGVHKISHLASHWTKKTFLKFRHEVNKLFKEFYLHVDKSSLGLTVDKE